MAWTPGPREPASRFRRWYRAVSIGDDGTAPVRAPLKIKPTAAPTGTGEEGDIYADSTSHLLLYHNGTVATPLSGVRPVYLTTKVLTAADSGAHCVFSVTTVTTYTLPAAQKGLTFKFSCAETAAGTGDIYRIVCATGDFFVGTVIQSTDSTYTSTNRDANGSTHLAWQGNGSTTGGLKGDWLEITASDSTLWQAFGQSRATGTEASPWQTS